ncbi:hypothetical protein PRIO_4555 [Paenibacillus riograndensis SBR5]|uniref:Uncharacterized protein n=1 Tax=Paenibacillus riograndensis SBR5 TaxID=1073571 RepID=A0A0E4CY21_9BACL|nr:hypothetical protein PRIO_4555 [Paenibacillus riograndensis SBR5]
MEKRNLFFLKLRNPESEVEKVNFIGVHFWSNGEMG